MADTFAALSVATTNSHDDAAIAELPLPVGMVLGENQRPAFEATDSAALNFFFSVVPDVEGDELLRLLEAAWNEDAPTALRLIFQTGNVREGGKMDRDNFHRCLLWLWEHKPETVLLNLRAIPTHTCLKDLLSLLTFAMHSQASGDPALALEGALAGKRKAKEHKAAIRSKAVKRQRRVARRDRRLSLKEAFAATLNQPLSALLLSDEPAAVEGETATPSEGDAATPNAPKEGGDSTHPKGEGGTALPKFSKVRWVSPAVKFEWDAFVRARDEDLAKTAKAQRKARQAGLDADGPAAEVRKRQGGDALQRLFDGVVTVFVEGLLEELETLRVNPAGLGGLYGKWAPSVGGAHDKATRIVDAIAARVLVGERADATWGGLTEEEANAARRVAYTRLVLSPLRAAALVPEHFIGKGEWGGVDYDRMPSRCRLLFGERVFAKHDKERYRAFLHVAQVAALAKKEPGEKVKSVKVGALLPHEVTERGWKAWLKVSRLGGGAEAGPPGWGHDEEDEEEEEDREEPATDAEALEHAKMVTQEANLQWRGIVEGCKTAASQGEGIGCWVPVCDVSGSMAGEPMEVAIALSLLLAEVNTPASGWHGKMFTFDSTPELVTVIEDGAAVEEGEEKLVEIGELVHKTRALGWGGSTNIDVTMDLFLAHTIAAGTPPATLASQAVVIFSDMEFDDANQSNLPWETAHEAITAKFTDAGYPSAPLIVYWNLRASRSTPVQNKLTPGVLLLAGFSAGLLKSFLAGRLEEFTPAAQLASVLGLEAYQGLVVAEGE